MDDDLRHRYLVHIRTRVFTPDLTRYFEGVIRNISLHGALISTDDAADMPGIVYLRPLEAIGPSLIQCEVRWRRVDRLFGVRFCEPAGLVQVASMLATLRGARGRKPAVPPPIDALGVPDVDVDVGNDAAAPSAAHESAAGQPPARN